MDVVWSGVFIPDGLASRGLDREATGVLGIDDFPEVVHVASIAADAEFSLSGDVSWSLSTLGRTRTGEPRTDFRRASPVPTAKSGPAVANEGGSM